MRYVQNNSDADIDVQGLVIKAHETKEIDDYYFFLFGDAIRSCPGLTEVGAPADEPATGWSEAADALIAAQPAAFDLTQWQSIMQCAGVIIEIVKWATDFLTSDEFQKLKDIFSKPVGADHPAVSLRAEEALFQAIGQLKSMTAEEVEMTFSHRDDELSEADIADIKPDVEPEAHEACVDCPVEEAAATDPLDGSDAVEAPTEEPKQPKKKGKNGK